MRVTQSVVLTKDEYKLFCSKGDVKPDKGGSAQMQPTKVYEIRDREYTQKLLEKVLLFWKQAIPFSCEPYCMNLQIVEETRLARERAERFGIPFTEPRLVRTLSITLPLPPVGVRASKPSHVPRRRT